MRTSVIDFFRNLPKSKTEQFNIGFELYRKSPGKSIAAEKVYNASGYSPTNLENLKYDLQKLHGIKDKEIATTLIPVPAPVSIDNGPTLFETLLEKNELQVREWFAVEKANKAIDFPALIEECINKDAFELAEILNNEISNKEANSDKNQGLSLREEFPFLGDKDCPDELKILVADKISAWKLYEETSAKIQAINEDPNRSSNEGLAELAKTATEAFEENQRIYVELIAYKETGKVLGEHPIFKKLQLQKEVDAMSMDEKIRFKSASIKYLSDNKSALEKAEKKSDEEKIKIIKNRVADRLEKLALVNKTLGVS